MKQNTDKLKEEFKNRNTDSKDVSQDNIPPIELVKEPLKKKKFRSQVERKYFALYEEGEEQFPCLKIECADKRVFYLPYDHRPMVDYRPDLGIVLATSTITIMIKGNRLDGLAGFLSEYKVNWIKQSSTEFDDPEETEIFINEIKIRSLADEAI